MKKLLTPFLFLLAALAFAPSAFAATSVVSNVTADVPAYCEIETITDVHADFSPQSSSTTRIGQILVMCNLDLNYTLSSPTVDANGEFIITGISGQPGAQMSVVLRDNSGIPLPAGSTWNRTGTGMSEWIPFQLLYNPSGVIPAIAFYQGSLTVDLTAALP